MTATTYTTLKDAELITLRKRGKSIASCCSVWNISRRTYYDWVKNHKSFKEAHEVAEMHYGAWIEEFAIEGIKSGKDFNSQVFKVLAATKAGWSEKATDVCKDLRSYRNLSDKTLKKMLWGGDISASVYNAIQAAFTAQYTRENGESILKAKREVDELIKEHEGN